MVSVVLLRTERWSVLVLLRTELYGAVVLLRTEVYGAVVLLRTEREGVLVSSPYVQAVCIRHYVSTHIGYLFCV